MKQFISIFLLLGVTQHLLAQFYIQPGAQLTTTNNVQLTLHNASLDLNSSLADLSQAHLLFTGDQPNSIRGTLGVKLRKVLLKKSGGQLFLSVPVELSEKLVFESGLLDLNGRTLTLLPGALLEGERESSRIVGASGGWVQTTVPLQAPVDQNPGNLGAVITSSQQLGNVVVKRWHQSSGISPRVNRFYAIMPQNNTSLDATVRLHYFDSERGQAPEANLSMQISTDPVNQPWVEIGVTSKDSLQNFVEKAGMGALYQFSIAPAITTLPVKWGTITAECINAGIRVTWTTLQEFGLKHFVLQYSSNGLTWSNISVVAAAGQSDVPRAYVALHSETAGGYYRVRSVDLDDKTDHSSIALAGNCASFMQIRVAPVPARDQAFIHWQSETAMSGEMQLLGVDGRRYQSRKISAARGMNTIPLDLSALAAGQYIVSIEAGGNIYRQILIKQ